MLVLRMSARNNRLRVQHTIVSKSSSLLVNAQHQRFHSTTHGQFHRSAISRKGVEVHDHLAKGNSKHPSVELKVSVSPSGGWRLTPEKLLLLKDGRS